MLGLCTLLLFMTPTQTSPTTLPSPTTTARPWQAPTTAYARAAALVKAAKARAIHQFEICDADPDGMLGCIGYFDAQGQLVARDDLGMCDGFESALDARGDVVAQIHVDDNAGCVYGTARRAGGTGFDTEIWSSEGDDGHLITDTDPCPDRDFAQRFPAVITAAQQAARAKAVTTIAMPEVRYVASVFVDLRKGPQKSAVRAARLSLGDVCWTKTPTASVPSWTCKGAANDVVSGYAELTAFSVEQITVDNVERLSRSPLVKKTPSTTTPTIKRLALETESALAPRRDQYRLRARLCALTKDPRSCGAALETLAVLEEFEARDRDTFRGTPKGARCASARDVPMPDFVDCLERETGFCLSAACKVSDARRRGHLVGQAWAFVVFLPSTDGSVRIIARNADAHHVYERVRTEPDAVVMQLLLAHVGEVPGTVDSRWGFEETVIDSALGPLQPLWAEAPVHPGARVVCADRVVPARFIGRVASTHHADERSLLWSYVYANPCTGDGQPYVVGPGVTGIVDGPFKRGTVPPCEERFSPAGRTGDGWGCRNQLVGDFNHDGVTDLVLHVGGAGGGTDTLLLSSKDRGHIPVASFEWAN